MEPERPITTDAWLRVRELFAHAVLLEPGERQAFLDQHCGDDAALRREVESLLAHDAGAGKERDDPIGEALGRAAAEVVATETSTSSDALIGQRVGNIRVLEPIGRGGMGEVYAGFDERLQRNVALKAIRARHRLAASARARFLREARILSQLEHPNICRIYDYIEGEDRDFLVLELIEGKNLGQKLAEGLAPGRRMHAAIQIAEVLEAAHGKGVVHRDLKPQNVMVTRAGGTKVLDFGLARAEAPPPDSPDPAVADGAEAVRRDLRLVRPGEGAGAEADESDDPAILYTRQGEIVGTPVYMSPEQANGEAVTTASDMYSFGLMLQKLFTGRSPYPRNLNSKEVLAHARRGETLPATGIDKDLAALIQRLKSFAPAARPTAVAALERLRWIQDKPKRRLRRLIVAAGLLLISLGVAKYTFDLKVARDEATARQAQAEGLLGFMLEDLRSSLEPLGRLDLLDKVGDRAMAYFEAAPAGALSDEELARQAQALTQIGEVRVSQLRYDEALSAFIQAYERAADLSRREPEDGERLFGRGQAEFWVGNTHYRRADFDQARAWLGRYLATCESLLRLDPNRDDWIREVAYGHHNLAVLSMELRDLEAAKSGFQEEVAVLTTLLERQPQDDALKEDLADAFSWLGSTHRRRAELESASRAFAESSRLFAALVVKDPSNQRWQYWRAVGLVYEAGTAAISGELDPALQLLGEGLATLDRLVAADPGNRRWRRFRARAQVVRVEVLSASGRLAEALREVTAAGGELAGLVALEPTDRQALQLRIRSWRVQGMLHLQLGETEAAQRSLALARSAAEEALDVAHARDPLFLAELATCLVVLGELESKRGNPTEADGLWEQSIRLLGDPIEDTEDPDLLDPWIRAQLLLGRSDRARPVLERLSAGGYRPLRVWPAAESQARGSRHHPPVVVWVQPEEKVR